MIKLKNDDEIALMRKAGKITADALEVAHEHIKPGVTTLQIDTAIRHYIERCGATPSFLGYGGFPASACISLNNVVIHGIPSARQILEGDIVKVDVGASFKGFHGDAARTFFCGKVSEEAVKLEKVTRESFFEGIKMAKPDARIGDISNAIQTYVESFGYSVVREFVGHGIGEHLHESPDIPNYGRPGRGVRLCKGMTLAIEPMVNAGGYAVRILGDEWTVETIDGSLSAHYENTVLITEDGAELLTVS